MENYSLLMGDSSVDEDGGGVDGEAFRGHFPVPAACRNRDSCPPDLGFAMAAALAPKSIRQIQSMLNESLKIFETLNLTKSWDAILIHLCSTRLPEETMRYWENSLKDHKVFPTCKDMSDYLSTRIEILETVSDIRKIQGRENHSSKNHFIISYTK